MPLIILLVIDVFDEAKNGTTITARMMAEQLRRRGHEVRILSACAPSEDSFPLPVYHFPIVDILCKKQNFKMAKPDRDMFERAVAGVDLVHFFLPLRMERQIRRWVAARGIPATAAFHLQPENITYNIGLKSQLSLSHQLYRFYDRVFYRYFQHIHCPSKFIAVQLKEHGYRAKLHVISNGVTARFEPPEVPPDLAAINDYWRERGYDKPGFHILTVGRLSPEKRQGLLLKAAACLSFDEPVYIHCAGEGPKQRALRRQAKKLGVTADFRYYPQDELAEMIPMCQLYVHASEIEIEAISCLEAIATGLVPIIANSNRSATPQFALDERSLFISGDVGSLAEKITYWHDRPDERRVMSQAYASSADRYRIDACVDRMIAMFEEAIQDARA